jgi:ribonuclease E
VVDFIDMRDARHVQDVERGLREAMKPDKARHEVGRISRLGLLEISRQRMRPAAMATTYTTCPMCEGHGAVRTTESAALVALRKIHNRVALGDVGALRVSLPTAVALYLLNQKRDELARLEQRYDTRLHIELQDTLMAHQVEMDVRARARSEREVAVPHGGVAASEAAAPEVGGNGAAPVAADGTGKKKRRRRGRRRGSGMRAAAAIGDALATLGGMTPMRAEAAAAHAAPMGSDAGDGEESVVAAATPATKAGAPATRSRRGRRGGRRRRGGRATSEAQVAAAMAAPVDAAPRPVSESDAPAEPPSEGPTEASAPRSRARGSGRRGGARRIKAAQAAALDGFAASSPDAETAAPEKRTRTRRTTTPRRKASAATSSRRARTKPES